MHIMAIATFFMVLLMSFGAVSAADSNSFTNVNFANSGAFNVDIVTVDDTPMPIQGTISFKGLQYNDYAAIKVKWTDSNPGEGDYYLKVIVDYTDKFGDIEQDYNYLYIENGTASMSDVMQMPYMDLNKPVDIKITGSKIDYYDIGDLELISAKN